PVFENFVQSSKTIAYSGDEEDNKIAIARYVIENMSNDTVYILGPGTTVKTINKLLGIPATILGVDVLYNYKLLVKDAWEKQLIEILDRFNKAKIILSPIGGQGFILGRGNQQISPNVIKRIGRENIVIVSTWSKIRELDYLRIDTGDYELDKLLEGYYPVLVDYNRFIVKKVITVT
ncbi:MAG: ATP-NAD kinase, partial [Desulfurococcaceae archaeon]